jgi:hypothetical protein
LRDKEQSKVILVWLGLPFARFASLRFNKPVVAMTEAMRQNARSPTAFLTMTGTDGHG